MHPRSPRTPRGATRPSRNRVRKACCVALWAWFEGMCRTSATTRPWLPPSISRSSAGSKPVFRRPETPLQYVPLRNRLSAHFFQCIGLPSTSTKISNFISFSASHERYCRWEPRAKPLPYRSGQARRRRHRRLLPWRLPPPPHLRAVFDRRRLPQLLPAPTPANDIAEHFTYLAYTGGILQCGYKESICSNHF